MRTQGKVQIQRPIQLESNTQLTEPKAPKTSHWISASLMHLSAYESSSFSSRHIMNADCRMQPPFFSAHVVQRLTEGGEAAAGRPPQSAGRWGRRSSHVCSGQWSTHQCDPALIKIQERRVVSSCVSCHLRVESFESIETLRAARVCRRKGPRLQLYRNITGLPGTVCSPRCLFTIVPGYFFICFRNDTMAPTIVRGPLARASSPHVPLLSRRGALQRVALVSAAAAIIACIAPRDVGRR